MKIRHIFLIEVALFVVGSLSAPAPATNAKEETLFVVVSGAGPRLRGDGE